MLYSISALKQKGKESIKVELLVDDRETVSEQLIREAFKAYGIVILSFNSYIFTKPEYGKIVFRFKYKENEIEGVVNISTIKDAYIYLKSELELNITYINSLTKPLPDDKISLVLQRLNQEIQSTQAKKKKIEPEGIRVIHNKSIDEFKELVTETIKDAQSFINQADLYIKPGDLKDFQSMIEDLKKMRMGTNMDKLVVMFEEVLKTMEKLELQYVEKLKADERQSVKESVVTDLDVIAEYWKYKKSKRMNEGTKVSNITTKDRSFYHYFGKPGIYLKMLGWDMHNKFSRTSHIIYTIFDILELFVIFLLVELVLYYVYTSAILQTPKDGIYYYLWTLGLFGIVVFGFKQFRQNKLGNLIMLFLGIIVVYFILKYLFDSIFAF